MPLSVVILAAGQGKRMNSDLPKVLQPLAGEPLLQHVIGAARALNPGNIYVVYGHGGAQVQAALHQDHIMQGRRNRKQEGGAQEHGARDPNPANVPDLKQQNKKYGADLRKGIGFAEDAGPKVAQARNRKQHRARG